MKIQKYLDSLLNQQLNEIKYRFRVEIVEDIKNRLCSILSRWEEEEYRKAILFTTKEEALYYEPFAENEIRELVVAAVRNSMLEVAASDNCSKLKMTEVLSNEKIKELTSSAVKYFSNCNIEELVKEAQNIEHEDVYEVAYRKYPLAWKVLKEIAFLEGEQYEFSGIEKSDKAEIDAVCAHTECKTVVCDGYTLEFDDFLKETIGEVITGKMDAFFVDSFKMLSRNFEKILHVLQIILEYDKVFVTSNYYISNGYLEKRRKIQRAAHNSKEVFYNIQQGKRTPPKLKAILEDFC